MGRRQSRKVRSEQRDRKQREPFSDEPTRLRRWIIGAAVVALLALAGYRFGPSIFARTMPPAIAVSPGAASGFNVLLITLDTFRPDHLGCYGYANVQTPNLDGLAVGGVRFADAVSACPMTAPSHSTILTGTYPPRHGVRDNGTHRLVEQNLTLAEIFKSEGYATSAFISAFVLDRRFGFDQGFDLYDDDITLKYRTPGVRQATPQRPGNVATDSAIEWLERHRRTRPGQRFFTWVHYFDPHTTYAPPEPFKSRYAANLYDGEIAFVDQQVGRLLDTLRTLEMMKNTLVVVVGDHGEGLGEHSESTHSLLIYGATMRVPFIVFAPSIISAGQVVGDRVVSTVDVAPTILDLVGFDPIECDGFSLIGGSAPTDRAVYMESMSPKLNHGWSSLHGLRRHGDKYIDAPTPEYFDLVNDPGELNNLLKQRMNVADALDRRLASLMESFPKEIAGATVEPDAETIAKLAALGYVVGPGERQESGEPLDPKVMMVIWERKARAARLAVDQGRHRDAIGVIQDVLALAPDDARMWTLLSLAQSQAGEIDGAIHSRSRAVQLQPTDPNHWIHLARLQYQKEDLQAARTSLKEAERIEPDHGEVYLLRAEWAVIAGRHNEASALCKEARKRDPTRHTATSWSLQGMIYEQVGQPAKAREAFTQAHEADAMDPKALYGLARFAERDGQYQRVVDYLNAILHGEPQWLDSRPSLARAYIKLGQNELAVGTMQATVREDPSNAWGHNNLANVLFQAGRLSEAVESYRRALELNPQYATAHYNLAVVLNRQGDVEGAIDHYAKAVEIDPSMHRALVAMARSYAARGDIEQGLGCLERLLSSGALTVEQIEADTALKPLVDSPRFDGVRNSVESP